mgnify:CR=1 FL=1
MIQQVTKGIRISVETRYEGSFLKNSTPNHAFRYLITIENQSKDVVQLIRRHWKIMESSRPIQIVNGPGVVGKKPIMKSGQMVQYESGCILNSPTGILCFIHENFNLFLFIIISAEVTGKDGIFKKSERIATVFTG